MERGITLKMLYNYTKNPKNHNACTIIYIFMYIFILYIKTLGVLVSFCTSESSSGADPGGGGCAPHPPKIGKNMIFWRKIVIFHTKYLKKNFAPPSARRIFFKFTPPNLKSWIRPCSSQIFLLVKVKTDLCQQEFA